MKTLLYSLLFLVTALLLPGCNGHHSSVERTDVIVSNEVSSHRIQDIVQDSSGYVWLATFRGLNRFDGNEMHQYFSNDEPGSLPDNMIRALHCDQSGRLWVGTKNGVSVYNEKDQFSSIPIPASANALILDITESSRGDIYLLQPDRILRYDTLNSCFVTFIDDLPFVGYINTRCHVDAEDNLWIVTSHGITSYSTISCRKLDELTISNGSLTASCLVGNHLWVALRNQGLRAYDILKHDWDEDSDPLKADVGPLSLAYVNCLFYESGRNALLLGTNHGMFEYWIKQKQLVRQDESYFPFEAPDFDVSHIMLDRNLNFWLGSSFQGYAVNSVSSHVLNDEDYLNRLIGNNPVNSVALQDSSLLWIATMHQGIYCYNFGSHEIKHFPFSDITRFLPETNTQPYYLTTDSQGRLWISCMPSYVLCLRPTDNDLQLVNYYPINAAIVIGEASDYTMWIGTYGNCYYTISPENELTEHHFPQGSQSFIANLLKLKDGRMAVLAKGKALSFSDVKTQDLGPQIIADSALKRCVTHGIFIPTSLMQDHLGNLWMGTVGNGLYEYNLTTGLLQSYPDAPCDDIASIEEDRQGNIWVSTQNGLGRLDAQTRTFINFYKGDGLNGNEFYDRCSLSLPDGRMIFGGEHGLTIISPESMASQIRPHLHLEDLRLNNHLVAPSDEGPITSTLSLAKDIWLNYEQNDFSISYSAQDYGQKLQFSYQYKLEGLSDEWVDAKQSHEAFFSNIAPGCYIFRVRTISQDRQQVLAECAIPVHIDSSPWFSWWAILLYTLLVIAVIAYTVQSYRRVRHEKFIRLQTERSREQEKRINKMNMSFFANVSHEFRTPLTIISGPIAQLIDDGSVPDEARNVLSIVQRSVNRMLRLVNQMMDFHKLEDDALRLEVQQANVASLIDDIVESFQLQAQDKKLTLKANGLEEPVVGWIDVDKVEKIVYNLLGNALKYTPSPGTVELTLDVASRNIIIKVKDTGPGIPESEQHKVFDRYYQLSRQNNGSFNWGTGIGLYYCRRLVEMHHGSIQASNRTDGTTGSIFTVMLPMDEDVYINDVHLSATTGSQASLYPLTTTPKFDFVPETEDEDAESTKPSLVVVDDDPEIVRYLKLLLQSGYNVIERYDADSALLAISESEPELVISDVMMPGKDGYELCRELKNNLQICHIPVILVTAKNTTSDQIEGLDCGADAYVSKPFDPNYLLTLISNILSNRQKVRQLLSQSTQTDAIEGNVLTAQDNAFMTELYAIMEKELSNPEIDINHITDIMHVSRTKLYYKIKGLTGEKPGNFFRLYKLNRAAELIREGNYNVSEISDMTGFSSLSYFSTCFKKQFGVSPREYK